VDELHDQEDQALADAIVEHLHRVGVEEPRGQHRFALEPQQDDAVGAQRAGEDLHRQQLADLRVLDLVHHAHAAVAELFQEVVGPEPTQRHRVGGLGGLNGFIVPEGFPHEALGAET